MICCCSCFARMGDCSIKVTCAAPREAASRPNAPLPAKASRQTAPGRLGINQLNKVSRRRSGVGRNPGSLGTASLRPRHKPAIMRTLPVVVREEAVVLVLRFFKLKFPAYRNNVYIFCHYHKDKARCAPLYDYCEQRADVLQTVPVLLAGEPARWRLPSLPG
ncbi:Uncharacterised protein [Candidatus Venteria ishoeyi]|uniref:Uncharacterized protein n=1 Tax=Candidatus Venteria ishoeyi TaxID=1899563 RepID=A0A1H6F7B4_9GAMM|nr:Uncharacterised protein [Candidatus Venteria ishoeyi]